MTTLVKGTARANRLFEAQLPVINGIIQERVWTEDRRQNALCWAWQLFLRYLPGAEEPRQAAIAAATYACGRRSTFGRPPMQGYNDVMHVAQPYGELNVVLDRDSDDCNPPEWRVENMPPRLRLVALPLIHGCTRQQTAELVGCSVKTVYNVTQEIADWIMEQEGRAAAA